MQCIKKPRGRPRKHPQMFNIETKLDADMEENKKDLNENEVAFNPNTSSASNFPSTDVFKEVWRESIVWKYFNNVKGGATCRVCNKILQTSRRGTLCLEHHLFLRHREEYQAFQKECTAGVGGVTTTMKKPNRTYSRVRKPLDIVGIERVSCTNEGGVVPDPILELSGPAELCPSTTDHDQIVQTILMPINSEELISKQEIDRNLLDMSDFGSFKENKLRCVADKSTDQAGPIRKAANSKASLRKEVPYEKTPVVKMQDSWQCNDHAYAILKSIENPHVKEEVEEEDEEQPQSISQSVDMIVPDPVREASPIYPSWLNTEPERVVESASQQRRQHTQTIQSDRQILG